MDPRTLLALLESAEFQRGLAGGLVAAALGWLAKRIRPDWGLVWLLTVVVAAGWAGVIDGTAARQAFRQPGWVVPAAVVGFALALAGLSGGRRRPELPPAYAVSLGGIWATVPDTETVLVPLGVTAALLWLWWPVKTLRLGVAGAAAVSAGTIWAGASGAVGREGAYVGAFGALGSLVLLLLPHRPVSPKWRFVTHLLIVLGWTRAAGLLPAPATALFVGCTITAALLVAEYAVPGVRRAPRQPGAERSSSRR